MTIAEVGGGGKGGLCSVTYLHQTQTKKTNT